MIQGTGIDISEINQIHDSIVKGKRFVERVFTEAEKKYCESKINKYQHYAGKFAAKEAFIKAVNVNVGLNIHLNQIEILNQNNGKPYIKLYGEVLELYKTTIADAIHVSISHNDSNAIAVVIIEKFSM